MRLGWIVLAVVVALAVYAIVIYNRLVRLRNMVREGFSGVDVQLRRRTDLVPNLVETVKAYAAHERGVLEEVTATRASSIAATDVHGQAAAARALQAALGRLFALAEAYPQLKADRNFLELQTQLAEIEDQLQMARRYYNGTVRDLNITIQSFPDNRSLPACSHFSPEPFFELDDPAARAATRHLVCHGQGMIALRRAALALLVLLAGLAPATGAERIPSFISDVKVLTNSDLLVTETIRIQAEGDAFKHGLLRDFPTTYTRRNGTRVRVGFDVQSVTRDGVREAFTTERKGNGVEVRIGDPDVMLSFGRHEYLIRYLTTRQIGFFAGLR